MPGGAVSRPLSYQKEKIRGRSLSPVSALSPNRAEPENYASANDDDDVFRRYRQRHRNINTAKLQWLEHLWSHEMMFETGIV